MLLATFNGATPVAVLTNTAPLIFPVAPTVAELILLVIVKLVPAILLATVKLGNVVM